MRRLRLPTTVRFAALRFSSLCLSPLRLIAVLGLTVALAGLTAPLRAQDDLDRQLQIVYDRLSGKSDASDWDAADLEEAQLIAFRSLLPALSSEVSAERERARQQFEAIALHCARPGAEAEREREHWCRMMLGAQNAVIPKPARLWMLQKVAEIGRTESLERLELLLDDRDGDVQELARRALVRIPSEGAVAVLERALTRALENNNPTWTAAILSGLGHRRALTSPDRLGELAIGENDEVARAAISALAAIGTESCHSILHDLHNAGGPRQPLAARALLRYADGAPEDRAALVYRTVLLDEAPRAIRTAALAGLARVTPRDCYDQIAPILRGERAPELRPFAFGLVREFEDRALVAEIAAQLASFDESGQELLLGVLADRDDPTLRPTVHAALESPSRPVRAAALRALSKIGTADDIGLLARSAANARGRAGDDARAALAGLSGDGIDAAILRGFEQEKNAAVRAELLRAAAVRRRGTPASAELERYLRPTLRLEDVTLRLAAIEAAALVEPFIWNDLAQLLELEVHPRVRRAAEDALVGYAKRAPARWNEVFAFFQGRVARSSDPAKMSLARILGEVQNPGSLALLTTLASHEGHSVEVSAAALRAVGRWKSREALPLLRSIAESNSEAITRGQRRVARRGYLRILREDRGSDDETLDALRPLLTEELSPDDRRLALSVIGDLASPEALSIARGYLDDPEVTLEAVQASMDIATRLASSNSELAGQVFDQLAQRELSESQKVRLAETRARIEAHRGYVGSWEYAGPYTREGAGSTDLVEISFAPETNPDSVRWRPLRLAGNPWVLDLAKLDSKPNRAVYLRTTIALDEPATPIFAMGSDDGLKVWVDGKVVHANPVNRAHVAGQDRVPVALEAGRHRVLVKVTQGGGGWGFSLQLLDDAGAPFEGVTVAPNSP